MSIERLAGVEVELNDEGFMVDPASWSEEIAVELGTAREVVSRQLKEFEHRAWLGLARGHIVLRDRAALAALARKE